MKGDRSIFDCEQDYRFREPGLQTRADDIDPRTGDYKCNCWSAGSQWIYDYHTYTYYGYYYGSGLGLDSPIGRALRPTVGDLRGQEVMVPELERAASQDNQEANSVFTTDRRSIRNGRNCSQFHSDGSRSVRRLSR